MWFVCLFGMFVAWMLGCVGFIYPLEIVARILSDGVNRDRLCGTSAIWWVTLGFGRVGAGVSSGITVSSNKDDARASIFQDSPRFSRHRQSG